MKIGVKVAILLMFFLVVNISAKVIPIRSGNVVNAEFSTKRPEIANFNKELFGSLDAKTYAVVAVRLSKDRTISIFDYQLVVNNQNYKCVALRKNYEGFKYTIDSIKSAGFDDTYMMLFFVDATMSNQKYTLEAMFPPVEMAKVALPFTSLGDNLFTESTSIPRDGKF